MKKSSLLLFAFSLFVFACKKDTNTIIKEVPVSYSWSLDSAIKGYDKILYASVPLNDSTLAVVTGNLINYVNPNSLNQSITGAYLVNSTYGLYPPTVTKNVTASFIDVDHLGIYSTVSPNSIGSFIFSPTYSNSTTSIKGMPPAIYSNQAYSIVNAKYLLVPTEIDFTSQVANVAMIQMDTTTYSPNPAGQLYFTSSKYISLKPDTSTIGFSSGNYFSASYFGKFFLSYFTQFYRIDTLCHVKSFGYNPIGAPNGNVSQMFTINNYLFAINDGSFLISKDEGETWSLFATPGYPYPQLQYMNVGKDVYAAFKSQIFKVTLNGSSLVVQELDNSGLATNQITSINKCGKYAFVTTTSGLYYRDTATFNTLKK